MTDYIDQLRGASSRSVREIPPPIGTVPVEEHAVAAEVSTWNPNGDEWVARWVGICRAPIDAGKDTAGEPAVIDCRGVLVVSHADPRFYCIRCHNAVAGGRWRRVVFPVGRAMGEDVLGTRHPANRNWEPGESVADLITQNDAAGDAVPDYVRLAVGLAPA
ncbi:MAG: hypothetical protein IIB38_03570 [Candidatus Hydrogenedentes bacterium]|nr:hypothetical protein [Candidatus Hydrogenedentota bacterium]